MPFVEVLLTDGLTGEVAGQDGLNVGGGIEPIEEGGAFLVRGETLVEFIAQGAREAGDFTVASHNCFERFHQCYSGVPRPSAEGSF